MDISLTASAMDIPSVDDLVSKLRVPFLKIGSGDSNNPLMLGHVANNHADVNLVVSTGMSDMAQVQKIHDISSIKGAKKNLVLMHCTSAYPTPPEEANLKVVTRFQEVFPQTIIGYSGILKIKHLTL